MGSRGTDGPFTNLQTDNNNVNEQGHESPPPAYSEHTCFNASPPYPGNPADSGLYQQGDAIPSDPPPSYSDSGVNASSPNGQPLSQSVTTQPQKNQRQQQPSASNQVAPHQGGCCETTDDACTICLCCCILFEVFQ